MSEDTALGSLRRGGEQRIPRPAAWRPGPRASWWEKPIRNLSGIRRALEARGAGGRPGGPANPRVELPDATDREAAVLCALFEDACGRVEIVLTRRAASLRSHTGEVALPGGRLEPGETPEAGALREANEEVGIDPRDVELIGRLSSLGTYRRGGGSAPITPFVGALPARPHLRANPAEVARAFCVTLDELASPDAYHSELWTDAAGTERLMHFFVLDGDTVWGATARMLDELLDVATRPD